MVNGLDVIVSLNQRVGHGVCYAAPGADIGVALFNATPDGSNGLASIYDELALYCQAGGMTVLRFGLRRPGLFVPTVLDLRAVTAALCERGVQRMVFVVEATSDRSAAFAPIAYRSVVGLVGKVMGVATILNATGEDPSARRHFIPPDLRFLYRMARSRASGEVFAHENVRPDGLSELLLAPDTGKSALGVSVIAPIYEWCRRTLLGGVAGARSNAGQSTSSLAELDYCADDEKQTLADLAGLTVTEQSRRDPQPSVVLSEARAWLGDEWQRIVTEQSRRDPERSVLLSYQLESKELATPHLLDIVRRSTIGWPYLDDVARYEWLAAVMAAARVVRGHNNVTAHIELTHYSA